MNKSLFRFYYLFIIPFFLLSEYHANKPTPPIIYRQGEQIKNPMIKAFSNVILVIVHVTFCNTFLHMAHWALTSDEEKSRRAPRNNIVNEIFKFHSSR